MRMEKENELKEDEAYSGQEEEDEACIDPDSLSYIDEKIQNVLGHFQKDFEGGVSAENLGAKFGGYGSFLPTYQRSPSILTQPKSPQRVPGQNIERSTYCASFEGSCNNLSVAASSSVDKSKNISLCPMDDPVKNDMCMTTNNCELSSQKNSLNKPTSGIEHKTLKVRIKVGPDSNLIRNNAAIYSGLGLDISPSPSLEESPDGSGGNFCELRDLSDESPKTILQVMTCFSVPGGRLLSPLEDNIAQLTEKKNSLLKSRKDMFRERIPDKESDHGEFTLPVREVNGHVGKKTKSGRKKAQSKESKNPRVQDDIDSILNREIGIETAVGQKMASSIQDVPLLSGSRNDGEKSERRMMYNATKTATMSLDDSREANKVSGKSKFLSSVQASDKQLQLTENFMNCRVLNLGNEVTHSRENSNNKKISLDNMPEERNAVDNIELPYNSQRDGRMKAENDLDKCNDKTHFSGYKERNEQTVEHSDNFKQISFQKATSHVFGGEMLKGQTPNSDRTRKVKVGRSSSKSLWDLSKDSSSGNSSAAMKERKNSDVKTNKKDKVLKPYKEASGVGFRESCGGVTRGANAEHLESGSGLLDPQVGMKHKIVKPEGYKELIQSAQNLKENPGGKKVDKTSTYGVFASEAAPVPLTRDAPPTEATMAPHGAVVIEENWVNCDKCLKWRLLPYGTNTACLPKKWQCSLLDWLPGMNSCDFSEEETTEALNALYMVPAPDIAASGFTSTNEMHLSQDPVLNNQTVPTVGRKKVKGVSNIASHSAMSQSSNSTKKNQCALETSSSNKGGFDNSSKITAFDKEKQKQKQDDKHNVACYSDGGELIRKTEKHSKSKSKREAGPDDIRASKKLKKQRLLYAINDGMSDHDSIVKVFEASTNGLSNKVLSSNQSRYLNFDLADSTHDMKPSSSGSSKKLKREHFSVSDVKNSGSISLSIKKRKMKEWQESHHNEESLFAVQNAEHRVIGEGFPSQNGSLEERKAKLARSEREVFKASKLDSRTNKKGNLGRAVFPASGENLPDAMDDRGHHFVGKEYELSKFKHNAGSHIGLDFDPLKRELAFAQIVNAANSSSSKVSGSCRSKNNPPETKGSPVESVSSSPVKIPSIGKSHKMTSAQMGDEINVDSSMLGMRDCQENYPAQLSGGKYEEKLHVKRAAHVLASEIMQTNLAFPSEGPLGQLSRPIYEYPNKNDYQEFDKVNNHRSANDCSHRMSGKSYSGLKGKQKGPVLDTPTVKVKLSRTNSENKDSEPVKIGSSSRREGDFASREHFMFPESSRNGNFNSKEKKVEKDRLGKKESALRQSTDTIDNSSNSGSNEKLKACNYSAIPDQHKDFYPRIPIIGDNCGKSNMQELQMEPFCQIDKAQARAYPDRFTHQESLPGIGRSQSNLPSSSEKETQYQDPGLISSLLKERALDICAVDVVNEPSKVVKQLKRPYTQNGPCNNSLRQATPNGFDTSSPVRKDGHSSVSAVLKEARALKHTANRLKSEGLESESTGLYFEAALKFLYAASLMEPFSSDSSKHGDAALMYSETARLCQYVAHEYEKNKEMTGAALAYKCVEVAYLKAAYCRNASASKDRHELHSALQMLPPGESPSSSASDIDNLNNPATLGKTVTAKGVNSPQVAGTHVIAARVHPQVLRLLHYTNDLNCAFEATKKSQIAAAAASGSLEKERLNGISSVRKVLDFNFHNVEELMRLVRLAMESIGH